MKCLHKGILQAYIDGELDIDLRKEVETHISECESCKDVYNRMKSVDDLVFDKMSCYREYFESNSALEFKPFKKVKTPTTESVSDHGYKTGIVNLIQKYRKAISAACAMVILTTCLTVQPVRAFISDALNMFRVENVKGISFTLDDIYKIRESFTKQQGKIDLDKLGSIEKKGFETLAISVDEAKRISDFAILLPEGFQKESAYIKNVQPGQLIFTLNVKEFNNVMKSFGAKNLLPESIDGKSFTINFFGHMFINYNVKEKQYHLLQMKSPEILVPAEVDEDKLYHCLVNMPILPENVRKQLKSIKDWKNTAFIPVVDSKVEEVGINGAKGFVTEAGSDGNNGISSSVVWYNEGVIYSIGSNTSKDDIVEFARSMR